MVQAAGSSALKKAPQPRKGELRNIHAGFKAKMAEDSRGYCANNPRRSHLNPFARGF
jgi:hypothetical protein